MVEGMGFGVRRSRLNRTGGRTGRLISAQRHAEDEIDEKRLTRFGIERPRLSHPRLQTQFSLLFLLIISVPLC